MSKKKDQTEMEDAIVDRVTQAEADAEDREASLVDVLALRAMFSSAEEVTPKRGQVKQARFTWAEGEQELYAEQLKDFFGDCANKIPKKRRFMAGSFELAKILQSKMRHVFRNMDIFNGFAIEIKITKTSQGDVPLLLSVKAEDTGSKMPVGSACDLILKIVKPGTFYVKKDLLLEMHQSSADAGVKALVDNGVFEMTGRKYSLTDNWENAWEEYQDEVLGRAAVEVGGDTYA